MITTAREAWLPYEPDSLHPFGPREAAHLLRRAGFGGTIEETDRAVLEGLPATLDRLFDMTPAAEFEQSMEVAGRMVGRGNESRNLAAWWLLRMVQTPVPLLEKMTLFWHGHFATGADKVQDARLMLDQNKMLREHALGPFRELVTRISRDPAMLIYLDSRENRKTRPNENYARELMELFCLGPGHYSEQDIKEVARCFTGWEIRRDHFRFNRYQHDEGEKSFLGRSGPFGGEEAIEIVLEQPAAARFLVSKLVRFFVCDDPSPVSPELLEPLAEQLRQSDFDVEGVVRTILASRFFFSSDSIARRIKSPVELAVGALRFFGAAVNMNELANRLAELGQLPCYPPNVKGWDGGRSWINASTILARGNLVRDLLASGETRFNAGDLATWARRHRKVGVGETSEWVDQYWLAASLPDSSRLPDGQFDNRAGALAFLSIIVSQPEFQLA